MGKGVAIAFSTVGIASITIILAGLLHADASTRGSETQRPTWAATAAGSSPPQQQGANDMIGELLGNEVTKCDPESVPDSQRCSYVWSNPSCSPKSGLLNYLALYYCIDNPPVAGALMLGWLLLLFCTMYVASDAFFCPTLELISDHLNLSPAVAGATLLAFGNGAPDLMSIIASMHSGAKGGGPVAPASVSMALSEPLGTGLFVGNIVLGATVLMGRASREVAICPYHFFKDVACYLTALGTILYCLVVGEAHLWQGACILVLYIAYMSISIFMPREVEKEAIIHPELLTLVPFGPWDDIPSEDVEGASWEDVMSEANGGSSTADTAGWSPTAVTAGFGGYFQWGRERLWGKKHKGELLRSWASGELLRGWSAEQQQWIEPTWHRLCNLEEPHADDGLVGLGRQSQKWRARKQAMSRRWSYGDVMGTCVGVQGRSPDSKAEERAWWQVDKEQEQELRRPLYQDLRSHGDVLQQGQDEERHAAMLPGPPIPNDSEGWGFGSWCSPPQGGPPSSCFAAAHLQQTPGPMNPVSRPESPFWAGRMGEDEANASGHASAPWSPFLQHSGSFTRGSSVGAVEEGVLKERVSGSTCTARDGAPPSGGCVRPPSTQPAVSKRPSAEPLALRRNVQFKGSDDDRSTDKDTCCPSVESATCGPRSREHTGAGQIGTNQQQRQQCKQGSTSFGVSGLRPLSSFERVDVQQSTAGQIQAQPPLPPQQRSTLPPHSSHALSSARGAHARSLGPQGSRSLSPASSGWRDGRGGDASRRRRSTAGYRGVRGTDARLSPASSRPGIGDAGIWASGRSHRRSHPAHWRSGVLHDKSHASSRGTSEQDVDDAGHWIADEPMLAQGDLEAAIPLLLEKRYDELHFLLRHAAPSTSLHYAEHAPSATPPHTSLAAPALREPQAPRSSSARASTEAPHVDSEGTMRLPHGAPHCPAHPPAGACVGSEGARDEGRRNGVNGVVRNVGAMGHDLDAVEEERRPARARGRAVSASGSAAGSTAATEMDVRAHLENEHLRLKKLVFFLQRQRQCRSFAAWGHPDVEAPASPQTLIHQHFRRRRRATAVEAHTRSPRHSADLGGHRRSQPGGYLAGGSRGGSGGGGGGWAKEPGAASSPPVASATSGPDSPPPVVPPSSSAHAGAHIHAAQPVVPSSQSPVAHIHPAQPAVSAASALVTSPPVMSVSQPPSTALESSHNSGVLHLQLPSSQSSQEHEQHFQQQQQQPQEGSVYHKHQSCHHHHHQYQQGGRVLHQHQSCNQQPHQQQHRCHQQSYQNVHGHEQHVGQHMLGSPFVNAWDGVDGNGEASGGSGAEKEGKEWEEDGMASEEVMDEVTLEWAEVVQDKVRWYFKSHTRLLWIIWHTMQRFTVALLSLTMPRIDRSDVPFSPFAAAVLMPVIGPCAVAIYMKWWDPFFYASAHIWGGSGGLPSASIGGLGISEPVQGASSSSQPQQLPPLSPSLVSPARGVSEEAPAAASARRQLLLLFGTCACVWLWVIAKWPRDGRLKGHVLGVAVVLTFMGAMAWMDAAANELVGLVLVAGQLLRIPVALLSATVLAWGNCMSDTVCNLTMAKDGYPTMAITACFASPMFILLAGSAFVTIFGTHAAGHGVMAMPSDLPTRALYITSFTNMTMWGLLVPLLFKFRLDYRTAIIGFVFYAGFQAMFVTLVIMQQKQAG